MGIHIIAQLFIRKKLFIIYYIHIQTINKNTMEELTQTNFSDIIQNFNQLTATRKESRRRSVLDNVMKQASATLDELA